VFLFLDVLSMPGIFMSQENNAKYHLKVICPICPKCRRKYRFIKENGGCWWEENWKRGEFGIPRHFGIINWLKSYLGISTNLNKFKNFN